MTSSNRDPSEALTVTEAARRLGVAPRTVKRMRDLAYFTVGKRHDRRYTVEAVTRYIEERTMGL